jgi:hypothetical protein
MSNEAARASDNIGVGVGMGLAESVRAYTVWTVDRWDADATAWVKRHSGLAAPTDAAFRKLKVDPYRTSEVVGNLITNAGWTRLMNLLTNQGATQALTATAVRIGAGNSNTAEAYADTDLNAAAGSANRWFQVVTGAGSLGTRTLAFAASFGTADGNFAWQEFGIDVGTPTVSSGNTVGALLFNHKAGIAQGTKASGQTWTATATISFS